MYEEKQITVPNKVSQKTLETFPAFLCRNHDTPVKCNSSTLRYPLGRRANTRHRLCGHLTGAFYSEKRRPSFGRVYGQPNGCKPHCIQAVDGILKATNSYPFFPRGKVDRLWRKRPFPMDSNHYIALMRSTQLWQIPSGSTSSCVLPHSLQD